MRNQRAKFSLPTNTTFLNCAYMAPLLKAVEKAGIQGIRDKRNPAVISPIDFFTNSELLRTEFAKLIHAPDPKRIVIIPSASYGLATVTKNLRLSAGEGIVVAQEQFPSNYYPWQRLTHENKAHLHTVPPPASLIDRGKHWNERILDAITPTTRVVALGNVHWADGTKFDLRHIGKRAREVGAKLIIDGTQSVGALPFDVQSVKPDALVCSGYKWLMGPYSIGLAYYGSSFDNGVPVEENWINRLHSENFAGLVNYQNDYQPGALRYEVGEHSNFVLVPMMLAALKQINVWGPENIQSHCKEITNPGIAKLRSAGFWIEDELYRGYHLFGIQFPRNVSVDTMRDYVKKKNISVSIRGNNMRVAPHVYNDVKDFDRLVKALLS